MFCGKHQIALFGLLITAACSGCEPEDTPGGKLIEIRLTLVDKNPGSDGRYILLVGERSHLKAIGIYDNGRQEDITLSLFWKLAPSGPAILNCEQGELIGNRVVLEGSAPGMVEVLAVTRQEEEAIIPCSPTPDGGWSFPDAGAGWPMESEPITVEVR